MIENDSQLVTEVDGEGNTILHHVAKFPNTAESEYITKIICESKDIDPWQRNKNNETAMKLLKEKNDPRSFYIRNARYQNPKRRIRRRRTVWLTSLDRLPQKDSTKTLEIMDDSIYEERTRKEALTALTTVEKKTILESMTLFINELSSVHIHQRNEIAEQEHLVEPNRPYREDIKAIDNTSFELQMISTFSGQLKSVMQKAEQKEKFIKLLQQIGNEPQTSKAEKILPDENVYSSHLVDNLQLVWMLTAGFSKTHTEEHAKQRDSGEQVIHLFADIVQCLAVTESSNMSATIEMIKQSILTGRNYKFLKYLTPLTDVSSSETSNSPKIYRSIVNGEQPVKICHPLGGFEENSFNIQKSFAIISDYLQMLNLDADAKVDIPFIASEKEYEIINQKTQVAILLLGRSGTGKTTCCFRRLWQNFIDYWEKCAYNDFTPTVERTPCYFKEGNQEYDMNQGNLWFLANFSVKSMFFSPQHISVTSWCSFFKLCINITM